MPPALPVFFVLVLVCSVTATAVAADGAVADRTQLQSDDETFQTAENTTNRLGLPEPTAYSYADQQPDLATTLAGGDQALRVDATQYAFVDASFDNASDAERAELLADAHERLQEQIHDLETRETAVATGHADGDRSDRELLNALVVNYHQAQALEESLEQLEAYAERTPGYALASDDRRENSRLLEAHESPIRTALATASESPDADPVSVAVETSDDGLHLGHLEDSTYLFETVRFDNLDRDASSPLQGSEPLEHAQSQYPWAQANGSNNWVEAGTVHDIRFTADEFDVRIFLDSGSGEVFREFQELSTEALPQTEPWTDADDDLEVTINATPAGGPAELEVREDGQPVSATVTIDDEVRGETDADGSWWYLPPTDTYELTLETDDSTLETTVE